MDLADLHDRIRPMRAGSREPTMGDAALLYQSNALAGEAGEVANDVKKVVRDGADRDAEIVEECGDVLFYMSRLLRLRGKSLDDAGRALLAKLDAMSSNPSETTAKREGVRHV